MTTTGTKDYARRAALDGITAGDYVCRLTNRGKGALQDMAAHTIAFPVGGVYVKHLGSRDVLIDPLAAVLSSCGEGYATSHPWGCGDYGGYIRLADERVAEIAEVADPSVLDHLERPFDLPAVPLAPAQLLDQRRLFRDLARGLDSLEAEERLLALCGDVMDTVRIQRSRAPARRRPSHRLRDAIVRELKGELSARFREDVSLAELAAIAGISRYHLCRLFRAETGLTLSLFRERLRLTAALDALRDPDSDLTAIALDLGFCSHSHFGNRFRRTFGLTPSAYRATR